MSSNYIDKEKEITIRELKESRINNHLSLRKKEYNKILNNKRKLFTDINSLLENGSNFASSSDNLFNNNIFKILSNKEILEIIIKFNENNLTLNNNLTEIFQCLLSLDYNINQNALNTINFMEENKIYIFLFDLLEKIFNLNDIEISKINNVQQLIIKILQIIFKYSSNDENNNQMSDYFNNNYKINIFNHILSLINNNTNNNKSNISIDNNKKTDILLYTLMILYNLSIESTNIQNQLLTDKIPEKVISIINDKKNNINITDYNIIYYIYFFSLNLLDESVKNLEENYIQNIYELLNEKGITSTNLKVQELSLSCLCNITSLFESKTFYKKVIYSGIFENIFKLIKSTKNIYIIILSLKIINNILTEKDIDINYFIKSSLLKGLMNLIINYEKNKQNLTPDLLHHIISIFLYLTKSPLFYSLINKNLNFMIILIELIGKISNQVTHDILTFIKNVIDESYRISQLIIYNNKELILNLINLIKDDVNNNKITIMASIILGKILRYLHEKKDEEENNIINNNDIVYIKEYEIQIKEIIELKLLNENELNDNLKKVFKIILDIIKERD